MPEKRILHNPELIEIGAKRHVPYGRIDGELTYELTDDAKIKPKIERLEDLGYKLNERTFSNIKELFSEDYQNFEFPYLDTDGVYIGAEHCNKDSSIEIILHKQCNLTFFSNLEAELDREDVIVMASSMGHSHPSNLEVQEIYEFQDYGIMVIDKGGRKENPKIDLVFMKPGGKVVVPGDCNMTIYSLQLEPLETHDFANPQQNKSDKDLQKQKGPIFCIYYSPKKETMFFDFNTEYLREEAFPLILSIPVKIPEGKNIEETLFEKARKDEDFKRQFGNINVVTCDDYSLPEEIPIDQILEESVKDKSQEFRSLFNIKNGN